MTKWARWTTAIVLMICLGAGCRGMAAHGADPPSSRQSGILFKDPAHGFSLRYPDGWSQRQANDPENVLVVEDKTGDSSGPELTVAVPRLPPHIPGWIPLEEVQSGYIDDLKKRLHDVTVQDRQAPKVIDADARRFEAAGMDENGERKLAVLLLVKGDHLYILTAEAPAKDFDKAKTALDDVLATWTWND